MVKVIFGGISRAKLDTSGIIGRKVEKFKKGVAKMKTFGISGPKVDKLADGDLRGES